MTIDDLFWFNLNYSSNIVSYKSGLAHSLGNRLHLNCLWLEILYKMIAWSYYSDKISIWCNNYYIFFPKILKLFVLCTFPQLCLTQIITTRAYVSRMFKLNSSSIYKVHINNVTLFPGSNSFSYLIHFCGFNCFSIVFPIM